MLADHLAAGTAGTILGVAVTAAYALRDRHRLSAALSAARTDADTDPLTGLLNRRALLHHGPAHLAAAARTGAPVAVIVVDLDHFKPLNDTLGHAAGDTVLRNVARVLAAEFRRDLVARTGGDEFAVLAAPPSIDPELAGAVDRLRRALPHPATVGVAVETPALLGEQGLLALLAVADAAMYRLKATPAGGGDRRSRRT